VTSLVVEIRARGHSRSLKLVPFESGFLFAFYSHYGTILYPLRDNSDLFVETREIFITHLYLALLQGGDQVGISRYSWS